MTHTMNTIRIEPAAPAKPPFGAPCNGCGVCCLAQPCPLGMVLSARRHGACAALRWQERESVYRCGAIAQPREVLMQVLPRPLRAIAVPLAPVLAALARRSIALEVGCDCDLQVQRPAVPGQGP